MVRRGEVGAAVKPCEPRMRADFPIGTRVRLSEEGMRWNKKDRTGRVVGYSRDYEALRIIWDGHKTAQTWGWKLVVVDRR